MMGFALTGSGALALGLTRYKFMSASLLAGAGIPIPQGTMILETGRVAAGIGEPSGNVPPFVAKLGVGAVIPRKLQRAPGDHLGKIIGAARRRAEEQQWSRQESAPLHGDPVGGRRLTSRP